MRFDVEPDDIDISDTVIIKNSNTIVQMLEKIAKQVNLGLTEIMRGVNLFPWNQAW